MFNLEKAIADWRQRMSAGGIDSSELLDELESHLREDVEEQLLSGTDAQQAFAAAVQRIGQTSALRAEFGKLGGAQDAQEARRQKLLYAVCGGSAALVVLAGLWTFMASEMSWGERIAGFAAISLIALYLCLLPRLHRFLCAIRKASLRNAIRIGIILACPVWTLLLFMPVDRGLTPHLLIFVLSATIPATVLAISNGPISAIEKAISSVPSTVSFPPPHIFTPAARESLEVAREEAARFCHSFIGTEHALLGVLKSEEEFAAKVLKRMGVDRETVRVEIEKLIGVGPFPVAGDIARCTPRLRKALDLAAGEARALSHTHVGNKHIFLGLLLEGDGVAFRVLKKLGIDAGKARRQILEESPEAD